MKTPFDDRVFTRVAWVHGVMKTALGEIAGGVAWKMTPVFDVAPARYLDGLPRDLPPFQFVRYKDDSGFTLEMEIRTGGRGSGAIEYVQNSHGTQMLLLRDRRLPDTIRSSLADRPLSDLVRHHWIPESRIISVEAIHDNQDLKVLMGPIPGE